MCGKIRYISNLIVSIKTLSGGIIFRFLKFMFSPFILLYNQNAKSFKTECFLSLL